MKAFIYLISHLKQSIYSMFEILKNYLFESKTNSSSDIEISTNTLYQISPNLLSLDIEKYYLSLYHQLVSLLDNGNDVFNKTTSPLVNHRLIVNDEGLISISNKKEKNLDYSAAELFKISTTIYQLAYASSLKENPHTLISKGIIPLLMRPLLHLFRTPETIKINALLRQLVFSVVKKENSPKTVKDENDHATIIQRAYRKNLYYAANQKRLIKTEEINQQLQESMQQHLISTNPALPEKKTELTPQYKNKWALEAKDEYKTIAKRLVNSLVLYRSHEKFTNKLKYVINQFNAYLQQFSKEDQKYIIVVQQSGYVKSNHWCASLALPHLQKKPAAILYPHEISSFKEKNPDLKHIVFIDDASYSGRQLRDEVLKLDTKTLNIAIMLPYYSAYALSNLKFSSSAVTIISGEKMFAPREFQNIKSLWSHEENSLINTLFDEEWSQPSSKVGVFFAHKIADSASTYLNKSGLAKLHSNNEDLIPHISPPYNQ